MDTYLCKYKICALVTIGLLYAMALAGTSAGQARSDLTLDPAKAITQYRHEIWRTKDGLPQANIQTLAQTPDGYLWIGTQDALVRFDGIQFTTFDPSNVEALTVSNITELLAGRDGTLWIGTRGGGLFAYADGAFRAYGLEDGLTSLFLTHLYEDRDGTLWVGTFQGGLLRLGPDGFTAFGEAEGLPGRIVSFVHHDATGTLRAGTDAGVFEYRAGGFVPTEVPMLAGQFVTLFHETPTGDWWVGTRAGGVFHRHGDTVTDHTDVFAQPGSYLYDLQPDAQGSLWLGFRGAGLARYRAGRFERFTTAEGLSNDVVLGLLEDREGGLWIATRDGLNRLQDSKFTPLTTAEGLPSNAAKTIHQDATGALWIGTEGGGLARYADDTFTTFTTADGLSSDAILSVGSTPDGAVWAGTYGNGLNRLHAGRVTTYGPDDGLAGTEVYALHTDPRGHLWMGTEGGLTHYDGTTFTTTTTDDGLPTNLLAAFADSHDGGLWIGTYDAGVLHYRDGAVVRHLTTDDGLGNNAVLALHEDAEGTLWMGTYGGGISRLQGDSLTTFTRRDGLFQDTVPAILEDDAGFLWMNSLQGIFRLSKADLHAYAEGRLDQLVPDVFGAADGLKSTEGNGGQHPSAWRSTDGRLWFPTTSGVVMIDPANIRHNAIAPPVVVERVVVDGTVQATATDLVLAPGSDKLAFTYTALSLVAPAQVRFAVRLDGHDTDWMDMGGRREAFYTNLGPGTYTFRVRAWNNDGVASAREATVAFEIEPFFYQTTWFFLLCLGGVLLLVGGAYRFRVMQLKAQHRVLERLVDERTHDLRMEKEKTEQAKAVIEAQADKLRELDRFKTRFFSNVSHEFRTPLTMIIGPLENALQGVYGPIGETLHQQADIMLRNAMRLMRLINQLLDLSKLEAGKMPLKAHPRNMVDFLEGLLYTFTPFAEKKNLALHFETTEDDLELYFEPDKMEKVFYNLLSNAAKFTPTGGALDLALCTRPADADAPDGYIEVRLSDTGKGIPAKDLPHIFNRFHQVDNSNTREHEGTGIGLALVKELILLHHGTIAVESTMGEGTTFTITIPRGATHLHQDQIAETSPSADQPQGAMAELASANLDFMHEDEHTRIVSMADPDAPLVLVVEDNKDVREYVAGILSKSYRIVSASDGVDGWAAVQRHTPDLILSDVMMPRMDGNELCRRIKADARFNHIPVVLLTARATHESKMQGLSDGADDYLAKPFNAQELLMRVANLLTIRHQAKALKALNHNLEARVQEQLALIMKERKHYELQLLAERDRAESSSRLKSSILDNVNHEFRTPLTTIIGYSQILADEVPEQFMEFARTIEAGGNRLLKTLNSVILLADAEAMDLQPQPLDPVEVARRAADQFRQEAEKKGLRLHVHARSGTPLTIHADPHAVHRTLQALLDNAVRFTEAGEVRVEVRQTPTAMHLEVHDTGIGIPDDAQERIFNAFEQGSTGLDRKYEGTGVGLTVAARLAEHLGGTLSVKSTVDEGSVFTLTLPTTAPPAAPSRPKDSGERAEA